jgi:rare lipoprotein A
MMKGQHYLFYLAIVAFLAGCSSSGRYSIKDDVGPRSPISVDSIEDAQPKYEPYSRGGNKDYRLRGGSYQIIKDIEGYKEKGYASWYGTKFHGHRTSNGEVYDMYSMSAAHKTLPIPSYLKITNLDNGKKIVVRVNDRGPFHDDRIVDLSYAAAYKLGVLQNGTAPVQIESIVVNKHSRPTNTESQYTPPLIKPQIKSANIRLPSPKAASRDKVTTPVAPLKVATSGVSTQNRPKSVDNFVIQVSASKNLDSTRTLSKKLSQSLSIQSFVNSIDDTHKVYLGPFTDYDSTQQALKKLKNLGYDTAFIKKQTITQ